MLTPKQNWHSPFKIKNHMHKIEPTVELFWRRRVSSLPLQSEKSKLLILRQHFSESLGSSLNKGGLWFPEDALQASHIESGPAVKWNSSYKHEPLHPHQTEQVSHCLRVGYAVIPSQRVQGGKREKGNFPGEKPGKSWEKHQINSNCGSSYKIPDCYSSKLSKSSKSEKLSSQWRHDKQM